jgi:hypothetical protein
MAESSTPVLALVRDLMFSGRIMAEARAAGVECAIVRDPAKLPPGGKLLIVDLNLAGAAPAAAEWQKGGGAAVGFVSHVDEQAIAEARALGIRQILARSGFVERLPQLLRDPDLQKETRNPKPE